MGWVKLDDGFWLNEKLAAVSAEAHRLYTRALSFSGQNRTDGIISAASLRLLEPSDKKATKLAGELVDARLWERLDDGRYAIHDYLKLNPSRAESSEAGKRAAAARWKKDDAGRMRGASKNDAARIEGAYAGSMPTKTPKDRDRDPEAADAATPAPARAGEGADGLTNGQSDLLREIQAGIKRDRAYDPDVVTELRQVVTDWPQDDVRQALRDCQRSRTMPWPKALRERLPMLAEQPKGAARAPNRPAWRVQDDGFSMEKLRQQGNYAE